MTLEQKFRFIRAGFKIYSGKNGILGVKIRSGAKQ